MKYCQVCGSEINDLAEVCPKCGVRCAGSNKKFEIKGKKQGILFGLFLGVIGAIICTCFGDDEAIAHGWAGYLIIILIIMLFSVFASITAL